VATPSTGATLTFAVAAAFHLSAACHLMFIGKDSQPEYPRTLGIYVQHVLRSPDKGSCEGMC
jgi:hypothetical protein